MITLKQLRHIQAISEHGSSHNAAKAIHLTHSALTRSIQTLEESLGLTLFDRTKQGMTPTAVCETILNLGEKVILGVKDIEREAELARNIETGHLHIIVGPSVKGMVLRRSLPTFFNRHPHIRIVISEATPDEAKHQLISREADLVISGTGSFTGIDQLSCELIAHIPVAGLTRHGHPLSGRQVSIPEVFQYPLVAASFLSSHHPYLKTLSQTMGSTVDLTPHIICSDITTLKSILLTSDAWVATPTLEMLEEINSGELEQIQVKDLTLTNDVSIIEVEGRSRSPAAQAFIDLCKQHVNEMLNESAFK